MAKGRHLTLEQLDGEVWGEPTFPSHLVTTCHRLRKKPVSEFSVEDLRIMIGQKIGLEHLLPIAVECLEEEPFAHGDFYPGDLLRNVVRCGDEAFDKDPALARRFAAICERAAAQISVEMDLASKHLRSEMADDLTAFASRWSQ
ncbi:MAG: contact-dependent growth inhibition system immunity protein [Pseudomonadota bacterium]